MAYEDGVQFLYFNTTGTRGGNEGLKRLLTYIQNSTQVNATDDATQRLHEMVSLVKESPKARDAYMMWEEMIFYERKDAREEGRESTLITAIRKKLEKNKTIAQIAGELEITVDEAEKYIKRIKEN